ncbi:DUF4123 domain-containing protein [Vibrio rhizosphaerae]|uniref:DUF4123 domain-containing protein n=1 Tax=Vibrio rhizosphaerae TaxID=398736 RepID=A0ABU4IQK5_9VIBR|nr:DUF4123 domain-containing protein [Vibrio rhizosphaerae]MDW6091238.1 DUF4123 domain-containing protein [Vibrio rhizosphaerae]
MLNLTHEYHGQAVNWYAVVRGDTGLAAAVYQWIDGHQIEPLYLMTVLETLQDESPLVIALKYGSGDPLTDKLPPEQTLYFSAPAQVSLAEVLHQLRTRMVVYFEGNTTGLLHYYHPQVASYFFTLAAAEETSGWLGLCCSAMVYRQQLSEPPGWVEVGDGHSQADPDVWVMQPGQAQALTRLSEDKTIAAWAQQSDIREIDWLCQHQVTRFCDNHNIQAAPLQNQLRLWAQQNQFYLDTFQPEEQFLALQPEQKIAQLEQRVARGL